MQFFKNRFSLFLLSVCVIVSVVVAIFVVSVSGKVMMNNSLRHLESVAELQEIRLIDVLERYRSEIHLIQSRTNMRKQLHLSLSTGDIEPLVTVNRILKDANEAVPTISSIFLLDLDYESVTGTRVSLPNIIDFDKKEDIDSLIHLGFYNHEDEPMNSFLAPLYWEDEKIAYILVEFYGESLISLTSTYLGLRETGETGLALRLDDDHFMSLARLRFKKSSLFGVHTISDKGGKSPIRKALLGFEEVFLGGITDYRSQEVAAVTRHVDLFDKRWALAVKMDRDEILEEYSRFKYMVLFSFLSGIFAVVILTGLYIMGSERFDSFLGVKK